MAAKTGKDDAAVDEAEAASPDPSGADDAQPEAAAEPAAGPAARPAAKRKRRVRVIEVIEDEDDLDEVLEALDAEDAAAEQAAADRPVRTVKKPAEEAEDADDAEPAKPAAKTAAKPAKPVVERIEPPDDEPAEPAAAEPGPPVRKTTGSGFGSVPVSALVVVVVLIAVLASLAIWQWRSASSAGSKADERAAVSDVARKYGDVALNYNASNYQAQMAKAQKLMGGDLLESFKATTLPGLGTTFKENPQLALSSKSDQVFVGSVDGKFATAVVMVDIKVQNKEATEAPATLLRLALAKIDGDWKVTKQYASGVNDQNQQAAGQQVPNVPSGDPSPSGKPKN